LGLLVALAGAAAVIGVEAQQSAPQAPPAKAATERRTLELPPGTVVSPGMTPDLVFIYTGDVIGYLDPCG
jgi:hypothetical protein